MIEKPLVKFFEEAFRKHWIRPALCNYDSGTIYSYADVARGVAKVHLLLEASGVTKRCWYRYCPPLPPRIRCTSWTTPTLW